MKHNSAKSIHIKGLVQGVGFRPFVYRMAMQNKILGWVSNSNDGVHIHAEGSEKDVNIFIEQLKDLAPAAAQIGDIIINPADPQDFSNFLIRKSADSSDEITDISPDIAVCEECLADLKTQTHRINYPFINCTNCGPRFTIIKGLPYDRAMTTMEPFKMCPDCAKEYTDVHDRRFHAQPVACNKCGPSYELIQEGNSVKDFEVLVKKAAELIHSGNILAVKGMGGYHLACDATNEDAVSKLRKRKYREGKPFAVMFRDLHACNDFMDVNQAEKAGLQSWRRPIMILKNKEEGKKLAYSVSNGFNTTGVMLPYMPLHYLLFEKLSVPAIVLTSGNISDEPVIIQDEEALTRLDKIADAFLIYDREIYNRTDDSVMMVSGEKTRMIRRSRGFAPSPVNLALDVDGIFAAGAELVNCFCVGKGRKALMSQHIGDLKNLETLEFYEESLSRFIDMFRVKPRLVACDLHPDYLSTGFAREFASHHGIPLVPVQHHHAHIASCMAENGLDEKVIGISMDGVGYGTDGNIWGFEVMACDLSAFERKTHLEYVPQPGGDKANHEPWRMALSYLKKYSDIPVEELSLPFLKKIPKEKVKGVLAAIEHSINCPLTSSAGRLFDAVAALAGVCSFTDFHAEAPMRLENILDQREMGSYHFSIGTTINPEDVIVQIVKDILSGVGTGRISARFHRAIVELIVGVALMQSQEEHTDKVVLSGGSFQNRYILAEAERQLKEHKLKVFSHRDFPSNDGGIALGQLAIAAKKLELGII